MKNTLKLFGIGLWTLAVVALGVACEDPVEEKSPLESASMELSVLGTDTDGATITATTTSLKTLAWKVVGADGELPTAEELFAEGTLVEVEEDNTTNLEVSGLEPYTNYKMLVAGRCDETLVWSEVKSIPFTTADVPSTVTLVTGTATATSVEITATVQNVARLAYVIYPVEDGSVEGAPASANLLFVKGTVVECVAGENKFTIENLQPNTEWVAYFAAEKASAEEFVEEIYTLNNIQTSDFADAVRVYNIGYNGFQVDVRVDKDVQELGHKIRWAAQDYYSYMSGRGAQSEGRAYQSSDAWMLEYEIGPDYWSSYLDHSCTVDVYEEVLPTNKDGNYILTPEGEPVPYIGPITPGQPEVFVLGEMKWGKDQEGFFSYISMFNYDAYGPALYSNPNVYFDQSPYWNGFYYNEIVQVKEPSLLDTEIEFELEIESDEATFMFAPNEDSDFYGILVLPSTPHYNIAMNGLNHKTEYMQWFATSYNASKEGWFAEVYPNEMGYNYYRLSSNHGEFISPDLTYYYYIVAFGKNADAEGYYVGDEQKMVQGSFQLVNYSMPAPSVEITAKETTANSVTYNIKCTSAAEGNKVKSINYLCNSDREWYKAGGTSIDNVKNVFASEKGIALAATEIDLINSESGFDLILSGAQPMTPYGLALKVKNTEGRVMYTEVVEQRTAAETADTPVEIPALEGQWTMTATAVGYEYTDETQINTNRIEQQVTSTVTIGNDQIAMAESIPQEALDFYAKYNYSAEQATEWYGELKEMVDAFVDNLEGQNRLLLTGWDMDFSGRTDTRYASPYDLFISNEYSGFSSVSPVYDFGPKWYLEFDADGNAWVPVNITTYYPMSCWTTFEFGTQNVWQEYQMMGYCDTLNKNIPYLVDNNAYVDARFPAEISEDGNTITIKGLSDSAGNTYYINMLFYNSVAGQVAVETAIISDIVLTRNTSAAAAQKMSRSNKAKMNVAAQSHEATFSTERPARPKAMTNLYDSEKLTQRKETLPKWHRPEFLK